MGRVKDLIGWPNAKDHTTTINQLLADYYFCHHSPYTHKPIRNKYNLIGDRVEECREVTVYTFSVGDAEDPDLYAAQPLYEWEKSDQGQWIMKNAVDTPTWHRMADYTTYGYKYCIKAKLMGPALTEWLLKYGQR